MMKKNKFTIAILAAGCLWGFMGLFRRYMGEAGFSSSNIIVLRCGIAALCFGVTLLFTGREQFRIKLRDIWCFLGSGIVSLLFFTFCYFQAMNYMSLSAAAILLYTAPAIVTLFSAALFRERLTATKLAAVVLAFFGCALVSGLGAGDMALSTLGILYGLGAGFGYAMYSIFARYALERGYSSNTINFYSCLLASIGAALIWGLDGVFGAMTASAGNLALAAGTGVLTCFLPYLLYTYGLTGMETGRASIMASVEPVVATIVGAVVFHESMSALSYAGVVLVLSAVVLLNVKTKRRGLGETD